MGNGAEIARGKWTAPECPFQIEYATSVLDEIRLEVVDAFFSLPRGGAEIGGILLGNWDGERVTILGHEPLDCEHAMGPSFTLSARDQALLAEITAQARRNDAMHQPVGWYHSHTRSEIFLSETDLDIHKRFFPDPWQLALVLKPHTFDPTRAGFFFREPDGSIRASASYQEFVLDVRSARTPSAVSNHSSVSHQPSPADPPSRRLPVELPPDPAPTREIAVPLPEPKGRIPITREILVDPAFVEAHEDESAATRERSWRALKVAGLLALGLVLGGAGYQTRDYWLPQVLAKVRSVLPKEPDSYLSLSVTDSNGQLKIEWDRNSPAIRNALEGTLEITDGRSEPQAVRLDGGQLASGSFSYERQDARVDVAMIAYEPTGQQVKEQASFLGRLPGQKNPADSAAQAERDSEAERAEKLEKDLNSEAAKRRKLEKDLKEIRDQLQNQMQSKDKSDKQ